MLLSAADEGMSCPPVAAEQPLSTTIKTLSLLLNTALPTLEASPLCQKPPSPTSAMARLPSTALNAAAPAPPKPYPMVELPTLNGGRTENRWQPMSQLT